MCLCTEWMIKVNIYCCHLERESVRGCLSKVVDHVVKVFDVPEARSNYFNASLPPPSLTCSFFVLLSVYTVIKNLIIDAADLLRQKVGWENTKNRHAVHRYAYTFFFFFLPVVHHFFSLLVITINSISDMIISLFWTICMSRMWVPFLLLR